MSPPENQAGTDLITLTCGHQGYPEVEVMWLKDGVSLEISMFVDKIPKSYVVKYLTLLPATRKHVFKIF